MYLMYVANPIKEAVESGGPKGLLLFKRMNAQKPVRPPGML